MIQQSKLYPLKFQPIIKEKIWGGDKLRNLLNKQSNSSIVGESWEISAVEESISVVANGDLKGTTLKSLIKTYKNDLVGKRVYQQFGEKFPLLVKFIDAQEDLSIQLHPNDILAKERHNSFGKTEMWYVVQADKGTNLIIDFKEKITKDVYESSLKGGKIEELLNFEPVAKGACYFINAGKIHAICKGALIAEIQQTSDITYRVYDWNRKDKNGNGRELHTEMALDALDFSAERNFELKYSKNLNVANSLAKTDYFTTNYIHVKKNKINRDYSKLDSFIILMCVEGSGAINCGGYVETVELGETLLIPADNPEITIETDLEMMLLEVYV